MLGLKILYKGLALCGPLSYYQLTETKTPTSEKIMNIAARYLIAKTQQTIKTLMQAKRNYIKGSELNQKAMMEAKAEHRAVSVLAFNGHANYKTESDYISSLNKQLSKLNRM